MPIGDWYLDVALDVDSLSHDVFYYGIGSSIGHARDAYMLILGNSRTNFAFPSQIMDEFAQKHNITFFNMGLGYGEGNLFSEHIIVAHDLRPKIVIVNADLFFVDKASDRAAEIIATSGWERLKGRIESTGHYCYIRFLRRLFPHFLPRIPPPYMLNERQRSALVRSVQHGTWFVWNRDDNKIPFQPDSDVYKLEKKTVEIALRFKNLIEAREGQLILTHVPTNNRNSSRSLAVELAARLNIPCISPDLTGMVTMDGSHLNQESAGRFAVAFLSQLESESVFLDGLCSHSERTRPDQF